jgi:hypothetical protein
MCQSVDKVRWSRFILREQPSDLDKDGRASGGMPLNRGFCQNVHFVRPPYCSRLSQWESPNLRRDCTGCDTLFA